MPTRQLLNRLRMRQVSLMLAICDTGTLREAATELGMTQPAATKMLHELERALGVALFDRVGRGLVLNVAGQSVLDHFKGMVGTVQSLTRELDAIRKGVHGSLSVGSIMAASPATLTQAVIAIRDQLPLLSIRITTGTSDVLTQALDAGELDVVIGRPVAHSGTDYDFHPLEHEDLCLIVANDHPVLADETISLQSLLPFPWILQSSASPMRELVDREFRSAGLKTPTTLIETSSILTTVDLISKTRMVAVIPTSVAETMGQGGLIRQLPYRLTHQLDPFGILLRCDRPLSQAAEVFVELLRRDAKRRGANQPDREPI